MFDGVVVEIYEIGRMRKLAKDSLRWIQVSENDEVLLAWGLARLLYDWEALQCGIQAFLILLKFMVGISQNQEKATTILKAEPVLAQLSSNFNHLLIMLAFNQNIESSHFKLPFEFVTVLPSLNQSIYAFFEVIHAFTQCLKLKFHEAHVAECFAFKKKVLGRKFFGDSIDFHH